MISRPNGQASVDAIKHSEHIPTYGSQLMLFHDAIRSALKGTRGAIVAEFGVYKGKTLQMISDRLRWHNIHCNLYGFDSFQGLPEAYTPYYGKGHFNVSESDMEQVRRDAMACDACLIEGYFQDTLESFLFTHPGQFRFVHMDADLYQPTKYVLSTLMDWHRLLPGSVIQFDEMFYVKPDDGRWYWDEYKAWTEFVYRYNIKYEWIGSYTQRGAVMLWEVGNE